MKVLSSILFVMLMIASCGTEENNEVKTITNDKINSRTCTIIHESDTWMCKSRKGLTGTDSQFMKATVDCVKNGQNFDIIVNRTKMYSSTAYGDVGGHEGQFSINKLDSRSIKDTKKAIYWTCEIR